MNQGQYTIVRSFAYIFDKAYIDFERLFKIDSLESYFVVRGIQFEVQKNVFQKYQSNPNSKQYLMS